MIDDERAYFSFSYIPAEKGMLLDEVRWLFLTFFSVLLFCKARFYTEQSQCALARNLKTKDYLINAVASSVLVYLHISGEFYSFSVQLVLLCIHNVALVALEIDASAVST